MEKSEIKENLLIFAKYVGIGLIVIVILILIMLLVAILIAFLPNIVDTLSGKTIIEEHIKQVIGNNTGSRQIAQAFMNWGQNNIYSPYGQTSILPQVTLGFYYIYLKDNKTIFLIKSSKASWIIKHPVGNCGEHAYYFAEMMNNSGFKSRVLSAKGEDHEFAEYFDENGTKVVVDGITFVNDTLEKGRNSHWSYVVAIDPSGYEEDVTKEYLENMSRLVIKVNAYNWLTKRTKIQLNSVYLKTHSNMYTQPIEVVSNKFKNDTFVVNVGSKKEYQLDKSVDFILFSFNQIEDLDLRTDKNITITPKEIIRIKNVRITLTGQLLTLIIVLFGWFYVRFKLPHH